MKVNYTINKSSFWRIYGLLVLLIVQHVNLYAFSEKVKVKDNVLILNAYHQSYHWADEIMAGVFSELQPDSNVELYVEYMDTKRRSDAAYYQQLKELYASKYKDVPLDIIIACDDNALNFLLQFGESLFPKVPVSFCGIVDYHPQRIEGHTNFTGVYETYDVPGTLAIARSLHPEMKEVVFVSDSSESAKHLYARFKRAEQQDASALNYRYLMNLTPDSLAATLDALPPYAIVVWAIYLRLPSNQFISTQESIEFVTTHAQRPVYCVWDVVGQGVVGGRMTTAFYQGAEAAKKAKLILEGEDPANIEVSGSPLIYKFDYAVLQHWGIEEESLPKERVLLNRPATFWEMNWRWLLGGALIVLVLSAVLILFVYLYERSKKAEAEVLRQHDDLIRTHDALRNSNVELEEAKYKAEEGERLKASFLENISHEIRTPMNGILGFANLLQLEGLSKEDQIHYLSMIEESGQRMVELIEDLVNISKLQSGEARIQVTAFPLNALFEELHQLYHFDADAKGLKFVLSLARPTGEDEVFLDRGKIELVLSNLLKNALKFTDEGYIKTGYVHKDGLLNFFVEDSGVGISKETQGLIFNRFNRITPDRFNAKAGLGLGLYISKEVVELMQGEIQLHSVEGEGSVFSFSIPLGEKNN